MLEECTATAGQRRQHHHCLPLELCNEMILFASCNTLASLVKLASIIPAGIGGSIAFLAENQLTKKIEIAATGRRQFLLKRKLLKDRQYKQFAWRLPESVPIETGDIVFIVPVLSVSFRGNPMLPTPNLLLFTKNRVCLIEIQLGIRRQQLKWWVSQLRRNKRRMGKLLHQMIEEQQQRRDNLYKFYGYLSTEYSPSCSINKELRQIAFWATKELLERFPDTKSGDPFAVLTMQQDVDFLATVKAMDTKTDFKMTMSDVQPPESCFQVQQQEWYYSYERFYEVIVVGGILLFVLAIFIMQQYFHLPI